MDIRFLVLAITQGRIQSENPEGMQKIEIERRSEVFLTTATYFGR